MSHPSFRRVTNAITHLHSRLQSLQNREDPSSSDSDESPPLPTAPGSGQLDETVLIKNVPGVSRLLSAFRA